jgi:hypothetical protein
MTFCNNLSNGTTKFTGKTQAKIAVKILKMRLKKQTALAAPILNKHFKK